MRLLPVSFAAVVCGALLSACVTASGVSENTTDKHVVSNVRTKIDTSVAVNKDCTFKVLPHVAVIHAPAHGTIDSAHEKVSIGDTPIAKRKPECASGRVDGVASYYISKPGYVGPDRVTIRHSFGDGSHVIYDTVNISVSNK
ncbi:hypothetical protein EV561_103748 [Rhizobium sp. BK376]|jgi:hypothetical protein|nr:hypothetical protein EV561_103748 [Rhizobium sp. BK376]